MQLLRNSTTGLMYNHTTASAWFDYNCVPHNVTPPMKPCTAGRHQVHIDTPGTIAIKLGALRAAGVRGVAWWNTGSVGYSTADHQAGEFSELASEIIASKISLPEAMRMIPSLISLILPSIIVMICHHTISAEEMWDALEAFVAPHAPTPHVKVV